jgi:hypothetical protein
MRFLIFLLKRFTSLFTHDSSLIITDMRILNHFLSSIKRLQTQFPCQKPVPLPTNLPHYDCMHSVMSLFFILFGKSSSTMLQEEQMAGILHFPIPSVFFSSFYTNQSVADGQWGQKRGKKNKPILSQQFLNIHKLDSIPPCNVT